jgi:hypothetical protein
MLNRAAAVALAALISGAVPSSAAVEGMAQACPGGRICAWFKPALTAPAGWTEDKAASSANKLVVLVPNGTSFAEAPARIYGRAFLNEEGLSVEDRVRVSNERWRAASPGASSERVADVARLNGSGSFQVYRYRNPARPQQPAEYTAFGEDRDEQGRRYGVLIVLTATSEASLRGHEKAFQDVLRNF